MRGMIWAVLPCGKLIVPVLGSDLIWDTDSKTDARRSNGVLAEGLDVVCAEITGGCNGLMD